MSLSLSSSPTCYTRCSARARSTPAPLAPFRRLISKDRQPDRPRDSKDRTSVARTPVLSTSMSLDPSPSAPLTPPADEDDRTRWTRADDGLPKQMLETSAPDSQSQPSSLNQSSFNQSSFNQPSFNQYHPRLLDRDEHMSDHASKQWLEHAIDAIRRFIYIYLLYISY